MYITVFIVYFIGADGKALAVAEVYLHVRQVRRSDYILIGAGGHGIEAHRSENIPGRHLTAVVVAAQSVDVVLIHLIHDLTYPVLRFPRFRSPGVEVRNVLAHFVAVHIIPQNTLAAYSFVLC